MILPFSFSNKIYNLTFPVKTHYKSFIIPFVAIIFAFFILIALFFLLDLYKSKYHSKFSNSYSSTYRILIPTS